MLSLCSPSIYLFLVKNKNLRSVVGNPETVYSFNATAASSISPHKTNKPKFTWRKPHSRAVFQLELITSVLWNKTVWNKLNFNTKLPKTYLIEVEWIIKSLVIRTTLLLNLNCPGSSITTNLNIYTKAEAVFLIYFLF